MIQQRCPRSGSTRPALMQGVGRRVESGGQKRIKVIILHQKSDAITAAITAISKEISRLATAAEQWSINSFGSSFCWGKSNSRKTKCLGDSALKASVINTSQ
jgi:hypothetical protein